MKDGFIKTAAASFDVTVADCVTNAEKITEIIKNSAENGVRLLALPELCITGYTCSDLFLQSELLDGAKTALKIICENTKSADIIAVVGLPISKNSRLYNCAAVLYKGEILGIVPKANIPNYNEFYEKRHFCPAPKNNSALTLFGKEIPFGTNLIFACADMKNFTFAAEICEDLWVAAPPSVNHAKNGANIIVNLSASNEVIGKCEYRRSLVSGQSARLVCGYVYCSAGDGESTTDTVFASHHIIAENGVVLKENTLFENGLIQTEIDVDRIDGERRKIGSYQTEVSPDYKTISFDMQKTVTELTREIPQTPFVPGDALKIDERCSLILTMQAMGLKKRIVHTHAKGVVIGISGGLDSTLALLAAVRAFDILKRSRTEITAISMPCFGTTSRTKSNAEKLCTAMGVTFKTVDIKKAVNQHFEDIGHDPNNFDVVYENSQAREREQVLMDYANKTGALVVGTGDLSELALGWATYNGDHMSMYGVNAGVPKTLVRYLVRHAKKLFDGENIGEILDDILATPVSPELLPPKEGEIAQKTEELVGPYELHDFYLYYAVRFAFPPKKVLRLAKYAFSYDDEILVHWLKTFYRRFFAQQFKRSCLPDGPKIGSVSLSPRGDWRMPSDAAAKLWLDELE